MRRLTATIVTMVLLGLPKSLWVVAYSPDFFNKFQILASFYEETKALADSSEEHHDFGFNRIYTPPTVNFNEIFTNSLSMLNDDTLTTIAKDEDLNLSSLPAQLSEFRPQTSISKTTSTTTTTTPKPRFLTAAYLKKSTTASDAPLTDPTTSTTSTTEKPSMKVLPLENKQKGVLDLIFPASRVRGFKNVFDAVRRILSHTFRK